MGYMPSAALPLIAAENARVTAALASDPALDAAETAITGAERVFVLGAGRSGIALTMTAMRLMHLGLAVHVVGEATTPAIREGDLLLVASGSGTTAGILRAAETAHSLGAAIVALTTDARSPLAELATVTIAVPAAKKLDRDGTASAQYAGSLFEQAVVTIGDALFHDLWQASGRSADDLWPSHSNLE